MEKSDIDLFLREKRQQKVDAVVDSVGLSVIVILGLLMLLGIQFAYQNTVIVGIAIGLLGSKLVSPRSQLLLALERQISGDKAALEYMASKSI